MKTEKKSKHLDSGITFWLCHFLIDQGLIKCSPPSSLPLPPLSHVTAKETSWDRVKSNNDHNMIQKCIFAWFRKQQIAKFPLRNIMNKT